MHLFPKHHCGLHHTHDDGSDPVRAELRKQVHDHRNRAALAVGESREAMKVSERNRRVAEEAIARLEKNRSEEGLD